MSTNPPSGVLEARDGLLGLISLMERERARLLDGALEPLAGIVDEKNRLIERLAANDGALRELARQPARGPLWDDLVQLAARASEVNRVNGMLIRGRLDASSLALGTLNASATGAAVYGSDGRIAALRRA